MRRPRVLLVAIVALLVAYIGGYWLALRHRFPIDAEELSKTGDVTLVRQNNYDEWIHAEVASAVWWRGGLFVRHLVAARGILFTFTTSGRVFVLRPPESDGVVVESPVCVETFWWPRDPLTFPFKEHSYPGDG